MAKPLNKHVTSVVMTLERGVVVFRDRDGGRLRACAELRSVQGAYVANGAEGYIRVLVLVLAGGELRVVYRDSLYGGGVTPLVYASLEQLLAWVQGL